MGLIHDRIRSRRKKLKVSVDEAAKAAGVSRATIYRYEAAEIEKIPTDALYGLAKVLRTSPDYLKGETDIVTSEDIDYLHALDILPADEGAVVLAYHHASDEIKRAVKAVLGVES